MSQRTLSISDRETLQLLPLYANATITGAVPYAYYHHLLDLALDVWRLSKVHSYGLESVAFEDGRLCFAFDAPVPLRLVNALNTLDDELERNHLRRSTVTLLEY